MLCKFDLKRPIHAPFGVFLGVKMAKTETSQFYPAVNAITLD